MGDIDDDEKRGDSLVEMVKYVEDPPRAGVSFFQNFDTGLGDRRERSLHKRKQRG